MKTIAYVGVRIGEHNHVSRIDAKGNAKPLMRRFDLRQHARHFDWGRNTGGAAQLAVALLADATGDDETALEWYQHFKAHVLHRMPASWVLEINDVAEWLLGLPITLDQINTLDRATNVLKGGAA